MRMLFLPLFPSHRFRPSSLRSRSPGLSRSSQGISAGFHPSPSDYGGVAQVMALLEGAALSRRSNENEGKEGNAAWIKITRATAKHKGILDLLAS